MDADGKFASPVAEDHLVPQSNLASLSVIMSNYSVSSAFYVDGFSFDGFSGFLGLGLNEHTYCKRGA
jgi:hypothetical protein